MEVRLQSGAVTALVTTRGAWMTSLLDERGDVLFPRQEMHTAEGAAKTRGGLHVCLPNFGPGGESGLPQHGFGRELEWTISDQTEAAVMLELAAGIDGYEEMSAELSYQLAERVVVVTLELTNKGEKELRVAPAFHPYLSLEKGRIQIDGEEPRLDGLAEAKMFRGERHTVELSPRVFTLESEQLPVWATWTDQPGNYICIEPSAAGFAFLKATPSSEERLRSGETKSYIFKLVW
jgi:glucose-6-phosphate 1-epimerase